MCKSTLAALSAGSHHLHNDACLCCISVIIGRSPNTCIAQTSPLDNRKGKAQQDDPAASRGRHFGMVSRFLQAG